MVIFLNLLKWLNKDYKIHILLKSFKKELMETLDSFNV